MLERVLTKDQALIAAVGPRQLSAPTPPVEFKTASASLTRSNAAERMDEIVESTQLQGLFEDVFDEVSLLG